MEESREFKAAQAMENALNDMSWNPKKFARSVQYWHRTLQQEFGCTMLATIKVMAGDEYGYDLRNKASHEICKKIVESGLLDNACLPFI